MNLSWFCEILWLAERSAVKSLKLLGRKCPSKPHKILSQSKPLNPNCCSWYAQWPTVQTHGCKGSCQVCILVELFPLRCCPMVIVLNEKVHLVNLDGWKNLKVILCNSDSTYNHFWICFASDQFIEKPDSALTVVFKSFNVLHLVKWTIK